MKSAHHTALALAVLLAGCSQQPTSSAAVATAPPAFGICTSCHAVAPGQTLIGPSLYGVVGRKAGSLPGFAYSDGLKTSGIVWNEATLDRWLTNPVAVVPGTAMGYAGQSDPAKRAAIIAYLKTLR